MNQRRIKTVLQGGGGEKKVNREGNPEKGLKGGKQAGVEEKGCGRTKTQSLPQRKLNRQTILPFPLPYELLDCT